MNGATARFASRPFCSAKPAVRFRYMHVFLLIAFSSIRKYETMPLTKLFCGFKEFVQLFAGLIGSDAIPRFKFSIDLSIMDKVLADI